MANCDKPDVWVHDGGGCGGKLTVKLIASRDFIADEVRPVDVIDHLRQIQTLSQGDQNLIFHAVTTRERSRKLVDIILGRGEKHVSKFLDVLL